METRIDTQKNSAMDRLRSISKEIIHLKNIEALVRWDQEVTMPQGASRERGDQLVVISKIIHKKETDPFIDELLMDLETSNDMLSEKDRALVRVMRRDFNQITKLPAQFVADFTKLTSEALQCWISARKESNYKLFQPYLEKIIRMNLEKAEYLGYEAHPYDALLNLYEEDLGTSEVAELFKTIKEPLIHILQNYRPGGGHEFNLKKPFNINRQSEFSKRLLKEMGYDFNRGREDKSTHPFTTSLGHNDRRVTNRYSTDSIEFIFSALHEGGHALYEQGISDGIAGTHLDTGVSLGIHESQSRLWENMIGRNPAFWRYYYPELQHAFPDQFKNVPLDEFLTVINQVKPDLIRVEADEVTYNFHILIRFELEKALMEKEVTPLDLPDVWNQKYKEYLGVEVPNDAHGVLQDIHWSYGNFGYFPTYTLGNIYAAQIWHTYEQTHPDHQCTIANGDLASIRNWLKDNIYQHGAVHPPKVLIKRVTGQDLNADFLINYLNTKYT